MTVYLIDEEIQDNNGYYYTLTYFMQRIAPRKRIIEYQCGEFDWFSARYVYCRACQQRIDENKSPCDNCKNKVTISYEPKY